MNKTDMKVTTIRLDAEIYAKTVALARANFRKPSGEGHLAMLLRILLQQAIRNPDRFGLQPASPQELAAIDAELAAGDR